MKLKKLIKDIPDIQIKGAKEIEITGISLNSKLVSPGNLFIAKRGKVDDGADYISEAIAAGAVAVATDIYDPTLRDVAQLIHPKISSIEGQLAAQYYQFPSHDLFSVGITGTNGKTTTSFLVKHLLDGFFGPCGLIGTIEYIIGNSHYQATRTTPDVCSNHKMLREMINQGCRSMVMEVSSHALDQDRTYGIDFDVAIFTNLTLDHLDYHQTMENYSEAKKKLFTSLNNQDKKKKCHPHPSTAVINVDSNWHQQIIEGCQSNVMTYGIVAQADLRATDLNLSAKGTHFKIHYQGKIANCFSPYIGRFNVYNYLAAVAVGLIRKISLSEIVDRFKTMQMVPGRMERVPNDLGINIYIDFAHSDDALRNVFENLIEIKKGRVLAVFGCGGDRDKSKRPKMAEACEAYADLTIVTNDNPRSENPEKICSEIIRGFSKGDYIVELDRKEAIRKAIEWALPDDIILIAGKGHEPYQIFAHHTIEFDDRLVAAEFCRHAELNRQK
ncbi:MAG: UDP-N-acetylmuramoyl-L-alanyl-D-glutamate--2,6-diaminopimelate ligase [Parachlamydiaceae bacterium]|nr:UDP-N-acetylmuramoyl-L-alanyl-D-glutamate--2,6-diaminopimelate ligase [Parachlamydiaceae bacterium]